MKPFLEFPAGAAYIGHATIATFEAARESRESEPDQRVKVTDGLTPAEMTFVIPGPRCALWVGH